MRSHSQLFSTSRRGALMGVALMLMLCTGLFLAGWVTIMSTRSIQVSWLESAMQRRVALENSRLLGWQTTMEHAFDPQNANLAGKMAYMNNGKEGGLNTGAGWDDLNIYASLDAPQTMTNNFPYNNAGLRAGGSYVTLKEFTRPPVADDKNLDYFNGHLFLKSHCPVLNGDLLVIYRKPDRALRELNIYRDTTPFLVQGRTVIRHPPSLFVRTTSSIRLPFLSKSLYIQSHDAGSRYPIVGTSIKGEPLLPSNLPAVPSSTGPESAATPRVFDGCLNVIRNEDNPANSLWHTMARTEFNSVDVFTKGFSSADPYWMEEYFNTPAVPPPDYEKGGYPVPFKTLWINLAHTRQKHLRIINDGGVVDQIVFVGQKSASAFEAAGAMSPLIVTLIQGQGQEVKNIVFQHENNRRLIFGIKNALAQNSVKEVFNERQLIFGWSGESITGRELRWRMTLVNEGHSILLDLHPNGAFEVSWIGGVMTNWSFKRDTDTGPRPERLTFKSDSSVPTLPVAGASYESLLPRDAWLESYFFPTSPDSL